MFCCISLTLLFHSLQYSHFLTANLDVYHHMQGNGFTSREAYFKKDLILIIGYLPFDQRSPPKRIFI
ncbi:hypothetical protein IFVP22_C130026 [Vibrio parahaemolyticus]